MYIQVCIQADSTYIHVYMYDTKFNHKHSMYPYACTFLCVYLIHMYIYDRGMYVCNDYIHIYVYIHMAKIKGMMCMMCVRIYP